MTGTEKGAIPKPFQIKTVRGEPYELYGRTLVPEARIITWGQARATVGTRNLAGWAGGLAWVVPVAVVETATEGERRIATSNLTQKVLATMLVAVLAVCLVFSVIRQIACLSKED
jgi:hypothetical protein